MTDMAEELRKRHDKIVMLNESALHCLKEAYEVYESMKKREATLMAKTEFPNEKAKEKNQKLLETVRSANVEIEKQIQDCMRQVQETTELKIFIEGVIASR